MKRDRKTNREFATPSVFQFSIYDFEAAIWLEWSSTSKGNIAKLNGKAFLDLLEERPRGLELLSMADHVLRRYRVRP